MQSPFASIAFVVCRESVEALLILGILSAWLRQNRSAPAATRGLYFLWLGAAAGVVLAALLAIAITRLETALPDSAEGYVQAAIALVAAALIVQVVFWMRRQGATVKHHLETQAKRSSDYGGLGLFVLALIAVAREGSETAIFLQGILAGSGGRVSMTLLAIGTGVGFAVVLYLLLELGGRRLPWRLFFRATEVMLLLLAASLVMAAGDALVSLEVLPVFGGALWDSSALLDDSRPLGSLVASLTGYRARPDLTALAVYGLYWLLVLGGLSRHPRPLAAAR